ncbi:hypothetical protein [Endozoicomonas sp. 8E]|uniref:hypothetical protein n=1 Tax=Endozoicomonas sp. 8E TaxID=3035692 RepID=UPI0029394968|nr:hypothetical protein [Endozoicomonas sp. 8E]WOG27050.1 hypothetical protein P6910_21245 [Endozoicomonas sp. 8E]
MPGKPSGIADTDGYAGSDEKRHRPYGYRVKTTITESISWQWLYVTNLLVVYELTLITKDNPLSSSPDSWPPVEAVVALGWLLKSYWNPDSFLFLFNPIKQQAASVLKKENFAFAIITAMFGSGDNPQQYPSSESSGQRVPAASTHITGYFTNLLYSGFGDGNRGPQQHSHTLGLNCFVYPCHGACRLRTTPYSTEQAEWLLNTIESSTGQTEATPGQSSCLHLDTGHCFSCIDHFNSGQLFELQAHEMNGNPANSDNPLEGVAIEEVVIEGTIPDWVAPGSLNALAAQVADATGPLNYVGSLPRYGFFPPIGMPPSGTADLQQSLSDHQKTCNVTVIGRDGQSYLCGIVCNSTQHLSTHKNKAHTEQHICDLKVVGEDGQPKLCGMICKNVAALWEHRSKYHRGRQTCDIIETGEDGQHRPCGKVCKNAQTLSCHKKRCHSGQKACDVIVVGEDGQRRPCGKVCKHIQALSYHKRREHTGQQTCDMTVIGKDGQLRPCGKIYMNADSLWHHKRNIHTAQQKCDIKVDGEYGQPRPCGRVCKNVQALSEHKRSAHTRQRNCDVPLVGKNGQPQPCGRLCLSAKKLADHKRIAHTGQQTCEVTVAGEDNQLRPCGTVCKNVQALIIHKSKYHRKEKTFD